MTQGVTAVSLRVVVLNLCAGVLVAIVVVLDIFRNAILPIKEFFWYMGRGGEILNVDKSLELGWAGSGGARVFLVEFRDCISGFIHVVNRFPHVFFFAEIFPMYLVLKFPTFCYELFHSFSLLALKIRLDNHR